MSHWCLLPIIIIILKLIKHKNLCLPPLAADLLENDMDQHGERQRLWQERQGDGQEEKVFRAAVR